MLPEGLMLTVFVDTNVFLHCKSLDQLSWHDLHDDEMQILIPRTVISEIDRLKHDGSTKRARRARSANSLFKKLRKEHCISILHQKHITTLAVIPSQPVNTTRHTTLDVSIPDDRIIIEILTWKKHNTSDCCLLTADTGLALKCDDHGLTCCEVPEHWLNPPEEDTISKENRELKEAILRLQKKSHK